MAELHSSSDTAGKSPSGWCDEFSNLLVETELFAVVGTKE
jgi:hypothetical protein